MYLMALLDAFPEVEADCVVTADLVEPWLVDHGGASAVDGQSGNVPATLILGRINEIEAGRLRMVCGVANVIQLDANDHADWLMGGAYGPGSLRQKLLQRIAGPATTDPMPDDRKEASPASRDTASTPNTERRRVDHTDQSTTAQSTTASPVPATVLQKTAPVDQVDMPAAARALSTIGHYAENRNAHGSMEAIGRRLTQPTRCLVVVQHAPSVSEAVNELLDDQSVNRAGGNHATDGPRHGVLFHDTTMAQGMSWSRAFISVAARQLDRELASLCLGIATDNGELDLRVLWARGIAASDFARTGSADHISTWEMVRFHRNTENDQTPPNSLEGRLRHAIRSWDGEYGPTKGNHLTTHARFVSGMAVRLGKSLGKTPEILEALRIAGLLHDIGKLLIPEAVLAKAERLEQAEIALLARHAEDGACMSKALGAPDNVVEMVRHHHTRFDNEHPDIPFESQILAVADALVTMTSHRPYMAARDFEEAIAELDHERGRQFDPDVVDAVQDALLCDIPFVSM